MSQVRASNPARICLGLDPDAGESPKILFDDAGVGSTTTKWPRSDNKKGRSLAVGGVRKT
jgi:hypothetical protein